MKNSFFRHLGSVALSVTLVGSIAQANNQSGTGAVYTIDNDASGNNVLVFDRAADGALSAAGSISTGGLGTGKYLGSQGALVLSRDGNFLYACDAGSSEVSAFEVTPRGLKLTGKVGSNGKNPISLALHQNQLFVLNAGGQVGDEDNITGFLAFDGKLIPLPKSTHTLSAPNTSPAQVGFSPDGSVLVVTEKGTSLIDTFMLTGSGAITDAQQFPSSGVTPYGFEFYGKYLVVSEAFMNAPDGSAVSSYKLNKDGSLTVLSASAPTHQTAACWLAISDKGPFAYDSNTPSSSISGYRIDCEGYLILLNSNGITANTGSDTSPFDLALTSNNAFLYSLNLGTGTIGGFAVGTDGSLTAVANTVSGIPSGATGLVAR